MHLPPISLTLLLAGVLTLGEVGHQGFLAGTPLEHMIKDYHYFSYYSNEALIRHFVMQKAGSMLLAGRCVSEVSDAL